MLSFSNNSRCSSQSPINNSIGYIDSFLILFSFQYFSNFLSRCLSTSKYSSKEIGYVYRFFILVESPARVSVFSYRQLGQFISVLPILSLCPYTAGCFILSACASSQSCPAQTQHVRGVPGSRVSQSESTI